MQGKRFRRFCFKKLMIGKKKIKLEYQTTEALVMFAKTWLVVIWCHPVAVQIRDLKLISVTIHL